MCKFSFNPYLTESPVWLEKKYQAFGNADIQSFHRSVPGYAPTPLVSLPALADSIGVKEIVVKDESYRFGLKAFKAMGASYAIYRYVKAEWEKRFGVEFEMDNLYREELINQMDIPPFCTATDGNHGRAVAWFANLIRQHAVIYVPSGTVRARIENINKEGAEVVVVDGDYDTTVRQVANDAERNGWTIISDTAYPGYTHVPALIMAGYTTMFDEIRHDRESLSGGEFTHLFVQSGVGSFAASAAWYYLRENSPAKLISVEPIEADCMLESVSYGGSEMKSSQGSQRTIMAGLNCATPSIIAWPIIRDRFTLFLAISDEYSLKAMKRYHQPLGGDQQIVSGESGAAGLGALMALTDAESLAEARAGTGLCADSRILIFNTEGDTDPEHFEKVISAPQ